SAYCSVESYRFACGLHRSWIADLRCCDDQQCAYAAGQNIEPFPGNAIGQKAGEDGGSHNGTDAEESFHRVYDGGVLCRRFCNVADERQCAGFKNTDCDSRDSQKYCEKRKGFASNEEIRRGGE